MFPKEIYGFVASLFPVAICKVFWDDCIGKNRKKHFSIEYLVGSVAGNLLYIP